MNHKMPMLLSAIKSLAFFLLCLSVIACSSTKKGTSSVEKKSTNLSKQQRIKYAQLLDVNPKEVTHAKLYLFIDEWWGVKYKYGGNTKAGVDCSGFVNQLYKSVYGTTILRTSSLLYENNKHIKHRKNLKEGDLVFFATNGNDSKKVSHVGVYLMNNRFVHAPLKGGVMINTLQEAYWDKRFLCGGRVR